MITFNERTYFSKKKFDKKKELETIMKLPIEKIILFLESKIFSKKHVKTDYVEVGGKTNLGMFFHKTGKERFATKIIFNSKKNNPIIKKEMYFNKVIRERHKILFDITPKLKTVYIYKRKLYFFVYEYLEKPDLIEKEKLIDDILKAHNLISRIKGKEVKNIFKKFKNKSKKNYSLLNTQNYYRLFSHDKIVVSHQINLSIQKLKYIKNADAVIDNLLKLKLVIIDKNYCSMIDPKKHYVFSHNDLWLDNVMYEPRTNKYKIIDWATYHVNLQGIDLCRFFRDLKLTFLEVYNIYIVKIQEKDKDLDTLRKFFITFYFILNWIEILNDNNIKDVSQNQLNPAFQYIFSNFA